VTFDCESSLRLVCPLLRLQEFFLSKVEDFIKKNTDTIFKKIVVNKENRVLIKGMAEVKVVVILANVGRRKKLNRTQNIGKSNILEFPNRR
jgi:hypothetical protein